MSTNEYQLKERALSYLTEEEIYSIEKILGREPNPFELNMFAAMWSEHISYKSSIKWIEEMPVSGDNVYVPAGEENAGVIDLGDNFACVIKMESHNHPIAVDPAQGAVWHIGFQFMPEAMRVVWEFSVYQLMQNDILNNFEWQHHQPPGEIYTTA